MSFLQSNGAAPRSSGEIVPLPRRHPGGKPIAFGVIAKELAGLAPIIDPVLELVRSECPECYAGARDPLGLYRPLVVIPRDDATIYRCDACGVEEVRRLAA
jgi:hypothetical protein